MYMNNINKLLFNTYAHVHGTPVPRVHGPIFRAQRVSRRPPPTLLLLGSPVGFGILILGGSGGDRIVPRHWNWVLIGYWEVPRHVHADGVDWDAQTHLIVRYTGVHGHFPVVECCAALNGVAPLGHGGDVTAALAGATADGVVANERSTAIQLYRAGRIRVYFIPEKILSDCEASSVRRVTHHLKQDLHSTQFYLENKKISQNRLQACSKKIFNLTVPMATMTFLGTWLEEPMFQSLGRHDAFLRIVLQHS